ncbi:MAG TPA: methyltransferase [Candidatus Dormibacteraeota bacterium]|nr:methyltransferase [Candidatus Dormibacteraeota bacterium]
MAGAYRLSAAVAAFAELGVADVLAGGARSAAEVAAQLGVHEPTLRRLLAALAGEGVVSDENGRYGLTPLSRALCAGDPDRTGDMVRGWTALAEGYRAFGELATTVRTGVSGFRLAYGQSFHEYLRDHPDRAAVYGAANDSTVAGFQAAVDAYDFAQHASVVDVGGGYGGFLLCLIQTHPRVRGIVYDLPHVVVETARRIGEAGASERITCSGGDAFESVPAGADAYVMVTVLRCFDDEQCMRLLGSCRAAMRPGARVLLLEMMLPAGPPPPPQGLADLQALAVYGGADRTEAQWRSLLEGAGLSLLGVQPAQPPYWWIVGEAAQKERRGSPGAAPP